MNNWIPKNKIVRFAVGAIIVSVVIYFTSLFLIINKINKNQDFYHGMESDAFKEERFLAIKSVADINNEPIQTLKDFFIQKGDEVKFIEKIEQVAHSSAINFEIMSIDVKPDQADSFKEDVNIQIKIEGSWFNTVSFIDNLNKMPFGVIIEKVNLDTFARGKWSGLVNIIVFREK